MNGRAARAHLIVTPMEFPLMNRRIVLLAAAAAVTAGPAFAQTKSAQTPSNSSSGASSPLGQAEQTHADQTAMLGGASLQMADIAMQKARHPRVREFARFEHDEQTTVSAILKSMDPNLQPPTLPKDVADTIDRLKKMDRGTAFDREFVSAQIEGHEKLRGIQEDYLKTGKDPATVDTTKLILGMIKEHLTLLSDLQRDRLAAL
jgi:putative membrane protein